MNPIQFAIEIETAMSNELAGLDDTSIGSLPVITLLTQFQKEFLQLLLTANEVNIDLVSYPNIDEHQLLGSDASWQQVIQITETNANLKTLIKLWSFYASIDKSMQFYHQAAVNSAHPQTRLFFRSLSHVKKILQRKIDGVIQIYYNHYWGELGFAPFMIGKN